MKKFRQICNICVEIEIENDIIYSKDKDNQRWMLKRKVL